MDEQGENQERADSLAAIHTAFAAVGAAFASFLGDETAAKCRQTWIGS